ncbi:MAG TPA: hypothetical protein VI306_10365 [Pyrinomonadaceae bacterium]
MIKRQLSILCCAGLLISVLGLTGCVRGPHRQLRAKQGVLALVYADFTKSINEQTIDRQKRNVEELFRNLPDDSKFFLFSIDRGTYTPSIYEFAPKFTVIEKPIDVETVEQEKAEAKKAKQTTELAKLQTALDSYQTSVGNEKGPVSCISNKLNMLLDLVASKRASYKDYEIRIYFFSDMIEQCQNAFDGKPITIERSTVNTEEKIVQDIQKRIDDNFEAAGPNKNLKLMGTKLYVVLTSQDDKQDLKTLKAIWNKFFSKLGLTSDDITWSTGNSEVLWQFDGEPSVQAAANITN